MQWQFLCNNRIFAGNYHYGTWQHRVRSWFTPEFLRQYFIPEVHQVSPRNSFFKLRIIHHWAYDIIYPFKICIKKFFHCLCYYYLVMICNLDDIIKSSGKILLLSHMNPDGDTLGQCVRFTAWFIIALKKKQIWM